MEKNNYLCTANEKGMANKIDFKTHFKKLGTNQAEVAERIGKTASALSQNINNNPTLDTLTEIKEAIGCTYGELLDGASPKPSVPSEIKIPFDGKEYTYKLVEE